MHSILPALIGALLGTGVGYAVYHFIGCRTGTCPLTGNPYIAMAVWGLVGALVAATR